MQSGRSAIGHPVDVATGVVFATRQDIFIAGKVPLSWQRHYSTALLSSTPGPLGPGWSVKFFATLTRHGSEYGFVLPDGHLTVFHDPEQALDRGGVIRDLGSFQELAKHDDRYVITCWNPDNNKVERYALFVLPEGVPSPLATIEDVTGRAVDLSWDASGRLLAIRQRSEQNALTINYNDGGRISSIMFVGADSQREMLARYEYDNVGRLVAAFDALGNADHYEYDIDSRLVREATKDGGVFEFIYDAKGRCRRTYGLDGYDEKTIRFIDAIGWTEVTDSLGHVSRFQWLPTGQVVTHIDGLGNQTKTDYDEHGRIISVTDPNGSTTSYEYDDWGNRSRIVNPMGAVTTVSFNENHQPTSITDPLGNVWTRRYDQANRLHALIDPLGGQWTYEYDRDGNLVVLRAPDGATKRLVYSPSGSITGMTDWNGHAKRYVTDSLGRVIQRIDTLGGTTNIRYDLLNNPVEVKFPDGGLMRCTYDAAGNLMSQENGNGHVTRYRYGPARRLLERIDPLGNRTLYKWGTEPGLLEEIVNTKGEKYSFVYDAALRMVREVGFDGRELAFEYDRAGHHTATTNGAGERVSYQRNAVGRVVCKTLSDGNQITFDYNPVGSLVAAISPDCEVRYVRDASGRVIREVQGDHVIERRYDPPGRRIAIQCMNYLIESPRDGNGRVVRYHVDGRYTTQSEFNSFGLETTRYLPGGSRLSQAFDRAHHLEQQSVTSPASGQQARPWRSRHDPDGASSMISRRAYRYDAAGWLRVLDDDRWGRTDYSYDAAERLTACRREKYGAEVFGYDDTGNLTLIERDRTPVQLTYQAGDRLSTQGSTQFVHDTNGRVVRKIEAGGSTPTQEWRFSWNSIDQLISVRAPDHSEWFYGYDAFGRRVSKRGPDTVIRYVWDDDVVLHEVAGTKRVSTWLFDPNSFQPIATIRDDYYSIITDHLGTPRELIDSKGRMAWSARYDSWGALTEERGDRVQCNLRLPGQWFDAETGLHYNRFRYYDPSNGRYLSSDPLRLAGGLNQRAYARNPINWIDPYGLEDDCLKTKAEEARDAKVKELQEAGETPAAVIGAYDPTTGQVAVGVSGPAPAPDAVDPAMLAKADALGGLGAKTGATGAVGSCAEFDAANQLVTAGSKPEDIQFTDAVRPRTGQTVPMCSNCQTMFGQNGSGGA
jgi:RHS repeat-associated protein